MTAGDAARADAFAGARERFETVVSFLQGAEATALEHGELEARLQVDARELFRQLYQDYLNLRATRERRLEEVVDASGLRRGNAEAGHERTLHTVFGEVVVNRIAYRRRGHPNLHPADAVLNLPEERHSHGLRRLAAVEAARGSFDDAVDAVEQATGQHVGKRQTEQLAQRAAADFEAFYDTHRPEAGEAGDVLVLSCDGKGIVMRPEALREQTAKKAATDRTKLATRLSKGEKRNRKRMAEVGAVYDATPVPRAPADVLHSADDDGDGVPAPVAKNKWCMASVVHDAAVVVGNVFDEAQCRDPHHERSWVALVDGNNNHQIDRIEAEAEARGVHVSIVIDFIHVLEYLWKATWCFFEEGDPDAEAWVREKAATVLNGRSSQVAAAVRRKATWADLTDGARGGADACADYMVAKRPYLDYPTALASGWPIATGVIEGACRHIVKDRMDLTGARWGLDGAEAVLKLRALRANGDFEEYWRFHLARERRRVHEARYADQVIPCAA